MCWAHHTNSTKSKRIYENNILIRCQSSEPQNTFGNTMCARVFLGFVFELMWFTWLKTCFYFVRSRWIWSVRVCVHCACRCVCLQLHLSFLHTLCRPFAHTRSISSLSISSVFSFLSRSFFSSIVYSIFAYVFHVSQICTYMFFKTCI